MNWLDLFSDFDGSAGGRPLYRRIVDHLAALIQGGTLPAGTRLPTNRELAALLQLDRSTIARAYEELISMGLIYSHVGRGSFVCDAPQPGRSDAWTDRYSSYGGELKQLMEGLPDPSVSSYPGGVISFAAGIPSADSYPEEEFADIIKTLADGNAGSLFKFSPAGGEPALRKLVLEHLGGRSLTASDAELMILSGSQQGIDLMSNMFLDAGDLVVTEDPTYFWAISNFRAHRARIVGIPLDEEGIRLDLLQSVLQKGRVKFIYLMPSGQNPTGLTMSMERRRAVLELARRYNTPIFEDDFSGDLDYEGGPLPPLRALPGGQSLVVYQGTFSKALAPGIRLGWLVAPPQVVERLNFAKRGSDLSTSSLTQTLLSEFLKRGSYGRHLERINALYAARRDTMLAALERCFADSGVTYLRPRGGLFIWMTLPEGMDARTFLSFSEQEGVSFSPGDICYVGKADPRTSRLSFIQNDTTAIEEGVERLFAAFRKYRRAMGLQTIDRTEPEHVLI